MRCQMRSGLRGLRQDCKMLAHFAGALMIDRFLNPKLISFGACASTVIDYPPVSKFMEDIQKQFRNMVAQTIKARRKPTERVQVNASFSKAEYRKIAQTSRAQRISPSRLVKDLALQSIANAPCPTQTQLGILTATIQETSQLLRILYRDSNGWQKRELKELRPLLKRFLQIERKASSALNELALNTTAHSETDSKQAQTLAKPEEHTIAAKFVQGFWKI